MRRTILVAAPVALLAGCTSAKSIAPDATVPGSPSAPLRTASSAPGEQDKADAVVEVVRDMMTTEHLKAVLVRVTIDGREIVTQAFGESMTGVPATTDMHFRNGAVAISYMSTLLLRLVDEKRVSLDDKVSAWLPDIPHTDRVTLGQLAQMTSGYVDFEQTPALAAEHYAQPFKQWTPDELLPFAVSKPLMYEPGTNWNYSHTNYVILGLALERITGKDLATALQEKVLRPLGLRNTTDPGTAAIPEPALHAFSSERRQSLQIPAGAPFYEETTYWNPSWTLARGAIQTTNLHDLSATAAAINSGRLLSPESYAEMVSTKLRGKTTAIAGCTACFEQNTGYTYGLGIVISGNWLLQDPLFSGESAVDAYLPSQKIAIAVAVTYLPEAFDPSTGDYKNVADELWRKIAARLAPTDPPPVK